MAKHPLAKRDEEYEVSRRALIKWTLAAGAAMGVSRAKIGDILEKTAGKATAAAAAASSSACRSVHIIGGNGGIAWFGLMWPQTAVCTAGASSTAAAAGIMGGIPLVTSSAPTKVAGTDYPLYQCSTTPWQFLPAAQQITGFVCGTSNAHTNDANASTGGINGTNLYSIASSLQAGIASVVPLITLASPDGRERVTATGAAGGAAETDVGAATDIVSLFNSAASRAGGILANANDASWYGVQYQTFAQLNRASGTSVQRGSYQTAASAAGLLGTNLAAKLAIQSTDLSRYGITIGSTNDGVAQLGQALIVTAKAFSMGLTNNVCIPAFQDDPHGGFSSGTAPIVAPQLKGVLDAFMMDLMGMTDSVTTERLSDITVITINGDTPKILTGVQSNWNDPTEGGANLLYVYGAGNLKTGWFGGMKLDGSATTFDAQANPVAADAGTKSNTAANYATGAAAYAIARRDERAINGFTKTFTVGGVFGEPLTT